MRTILPLVSACCLNISPSLAETQLAELAGEDYYLAQMPMVLSASRLAQSQYETPVAVSIIDRAMIDASGALDIPDLLRLVPGFQVSHASGHTASATYHGLSDEHARRMQVLIDDRPVYGAVLGGVRWTDLPIDIEDIERIEVVRGPNTAAYGANSFLGAINITTIHSAQASGTHIKLIRGNKDTGKYYGRHGGKIGEMDYRLTLARREDEGFKEYVEDIQSVPTQGNRHDSKRVSLVNFRGDYVAPNNDTWEIQLGYNGGPRGEGNAIPDPFDPIRNRDVQSHFQQIRWEHAISADNTVSLQFHHTWMEQSDLAFSPLTIGQLLGMTPAQVQAAFAKPDEQLKLDNSTSEDRYELEFQNNLRFNQDLRLAWGISSRIDRVTGPGWFNTDDYIVNHHQRLFGNLEWHVGEKVLVNFGSMIEHADLAGSHISPRLAVNYQLSANHGLRAGYSRAIRMPTIFEQKADTRYGFDDGPSLNIINASPFNLSPERMTSLELGYLGRWPDKNMELDVKLFHDEIEDRIHSPKDLGYTADTADNRALVYLNTGSVNLNGAEFSLSWRPETRTMASFNYAYMKGKGWAFNALNNPNNPNDTENLQDDVPTHTYSLFIMHHLPQQWDLSTTFYKVSAMKWLGNGDKLQAQKRWDVRAKKGFKMGDHKAHIALTLQNIQDEHREFRDENIFDTRGYLEVGLEL